MDVYKSRHASSMWRGQISAICPPSGRRTGCGNRPFGCRPNPTSQPARPMPGPEGDAHARTNFHDPVSQGHVPGILADEKALPFREGSDDLHFLRQVAVGVVPNVAAHVHRVSRKVLRPGSLVLVAVAATKKVVHPSQNRGHPDPADAASNQPAGESQAGWTCCAH